ncbi:MAG: carbohydrate ABC transporter permease [Bacillota bacterium]
MKKRDFTFMTMTIPALVLFFTFHTLPALKGIFYSFTNWKGYGSWEFVCLKNYANLLVDKRLVNAYLFTFKIAIITTIAVNVFSLIIAMALNSNVKFKTGFRGLYFIPKILGVLIVGYIFSFLFNHFVPEIGQALGIKVLSKSILGQPKLAWLGIMFVTAWQSIAMQTIIYLSGLQTIPKEVYEACSIDGASKWKEFWKITFPLIAPFFTINMVLAMRDFLMIFDQIIAMTNGGPGYATESITVMIYRGGFLGSQFAYQSANAVILFIVILLVSLLQLKILRKREADI